MSSTQLCGGSFLNGVRVLEIADELGEFCGKILAGLGADVIKIEPPGGEKTRGYGPFVDGVPHPNRSLHFWHYNFGKRGVTIDLDLPEGVEDFGRLLESADVLLDTRRRGYLGERGFGEERLKELNPRLIVARISPFGDTGPWADFKACDLTHLALGGVMMNCGYDPTLQGEYDTPPIAPQMWQSYQIAGEVSAIAIVAALTYRLKSGRGQHLSTSVHEAVAKNTETDVPDWIYLRSPHHRLTCRHSFPVPRDPSQREPVIQTPSIVPTKDGRWIHPYQTYLEGVGSADGLFHFLTEFGLGEGLDQDDYRDGSRARRPAVVERSTALIARLVRSFAFDRDVWRDAQQHGLTWAPVRRPEENVTDAHWAARETFAEVNYPELDRSFVQPKAKWFAPGLPWRNGPRAPLVGEHNAEILMSTAEPEAVQPAPTSGVVGDPEPQSVWGKPWALSGVRVIDLGWILASAGGGRFLAALGAEVIKVEHVSKIDMMRHDGAIAPEGLRAERDRATGPLANKPTTKLNRGGNFMEINTGKQAISLNLKSARGKEILRELIRNADVLVEGYSPGTLERMGLGYEVLRELNPRLVYVQQSGMGQHGTYGRMRSFGPTAQAMSGISEMSGLAEPYPPAGIGYSYLDWCGAYQIALAMLAGLYRQRMSGEGCWIDSSQVEAGLFLTGTAVLDFSVNGERWRRSGNRSPYKPAAPHGAYRTQGIDRWIALAAFDQTEWLALTRVLAKPEWARDARFLTLALRIAHQDELDEAVNAVTQDRDGIELMYALQAAGVPAGICQTAEDRCEWDPQLRHLGWLMEFHQTDIGSWRAKTPPTKYSETPPYQGGVLDRHGPNYGEDNESIYRDLLGYDDQEIEQLKADGVI